MAADRKCFYHPNRDATISCYQCHKALCAECIYKAANGKFCSKLCSEKHQNYKAAFSETKDRVQKVAAHGGLLKSVVALIILIVVVIAVLKIGASMEIAIFQKIMDSFPF